MMATIEKINESCRLYKYNTKPKRAERKETLADKYLFIADQNMSTYYTEGLRCIRFSEKLHRDVITLIKMCHKGSLCINVYTASGRAILYSAVKKAHIRRKEKQVRQKIKQFIIRK